MPERDRERMRENFPRRKFSPRKLPPTRYFKSCPNEKLSINIFVVISKQNFLSSGLFEKLFSLNCEKGKYEGDQFLFLCEETPTLTDTESREN